MQNAKFLMLAGLLALTSCGGGQPSTSDESPAVPDSFRLYDDFFMLHDETLPSRVDLSQDISQLNYQNLRLLRSYVYALHGHWFMEADLNAFFCNHTEWYADSCYSYFVRFEENKMGEEEREAYSNYFDALTSDYDKAVSLVKLTDEEQAFVDRIDERMAELRRESQILDPTGQYKLNNPNLMVNWLQLASPDPAVAQHLMLSNVAFTPTEFEQLFNVYEENDYTLMPSFITTDLLLQAYHMYFSYVLKTCERHVFASQIATVFSELLEQNVRLRGQIDSDPALSRMCDETAAFAAVAITLSGSDVPADMVPASVADLVQAEVRLVMDAHDDLSPLLKTAVDFPYSLFRPRGHYSRTKQDEAYFRAMMWLQRASFFREQPDQLREAVYLAHLINTMSAKGRTSLQRLNDALGFMMGESDNISIIEVAAKLKAEGIVKLSDALSQQTLTMIDQWLQQGFTKRNRIQPKVAVGPQDQLNVMPQRYMIDGNILGRMCDPLPDAEKAFPTGLDVFSILGVESARALLDTCYHAEQQWADYASERDSLMDVVRQFDEWDRTFYSKWLDDLVVLQRADKSLPGYMQTGTWQLKNLNAALASWALLKHDAILYAEQPIMAECGGGEEFPAPDVPGYVEPNVPFWQKLQETLALNRRMLEQNGLMTDDLAERTTQLEEYVSFCLRVSEEELRGELISQSDLGTIRSFGSSLEWFTLSVLDPDESYCEWATLQGADRHVAQVADVFTRNVPGCKKCGILYEATGTPHAMYVVVPINGELYLTRGAVYSYYEMVRPLDMPRLTDEEWQQMIERGEAPAPAEWFAPLLIGKPVEGDVRYIYSTGC